MSEFSVHRTADTIPALKYCLVLDGTRIAGGKPDYRGNNHLISWKTRETYGPIDKLQSENAKLRELVRDMWRFTGAACKKYPRLFDPSAQGGQMVYPNMLDSFEQRMRELGVEVGQ